MKKAFKYRIYPTPAQIKRLDQTFELCRFLYNSAHQERIAYYRKYKKSISYNKQSSYLNEIKENIPEFKTVHSQVLQSNLKRLDRAYEDFFRRLKKGEKPGFPRFKGKGRLRSTLYPQRGFSIGKSKGFKGNKKCKLKLSKIGDIPMVLHRNIQGDIKNCLIKRYPSGKWYVCFTCEVSPGEKLHKSGKDIGIDLGVKKLITMSNGEQFDNPKHFKNSKDKIARYQRKLKKLDWRKKEENKKRKAVKSALARQYEKVNNQKLDYYHKLINSLVKRFDKFYLEDLDILGMNSWRVLNREIQNASWYKLLHMLLYKAESAGKEVVLVDPKNTSSMCSSCGKIEKKALSTRTHRCECGLIMDRDINAAINIYNRGRALSLPRESGDTLSE